MKRGIAVPREKEWKSDPYSAAAVVIRSAVNKALDHQGSMSDDEAKHLTTIHEEMSK